MSDIDIEWVKSQVGDLRTVLERHDYDPRFGRTVCPNPEHNDQRPGSVWIYKAKNGDERLKCFSCEFNGDAIDVARALGESISWKPDSHRSFRRRSKKLGFTRRHHRKRQRLLNQFKDDLTIENDWLLAKKFAMLGSEQAVYTEVVRNWAYLTAGGFNLPRAYELCQRIWAYGSERFGLPHGQEFKHWVERVETSVL